MISRTSWLRLASKSNSSVSGVIAKLSGANWRRSRIFSPIAVPPGSRVTSTGTPARSRRDASRFTCVDVPEPSEPSNVINTPRDIRASVKHSSAVVEPLVLIYGSLREKLLARETGTVRIFVGEFRRGWQNALDRRPELRGAE